MMNEVFWVVTPFGEKTYTSEEHIASIFMVEEQTKEATNKLRQLHTLGACQPTSD
jgi:hypothetical protein